MSAATDPARAAEQRMRDAGMPEAAIADFLDHLDRLRSGETGTLPSAELEPVRDVPTAADLPDRVRARGARPHRRRQAKRRSGHEQLEGAA